jgi:hypothetical protein
MSTASVEAYTETQAIGERERDPAMLEAPGGRRLFEETLDELAAAAEELTTT